MSHETKKIHHLHSPLLHEGPIFSSNYPPFTNTWGETLFQKYDPDGNLRTQGPRQQWVSSIENLPENINGFLLRTFEELEIEIACVVVFMQG